MSLANYHSVLKYYTYKKKAVVLLINEIKVKSEKEFRSLFAFSDPEIIFIKHNGDSTGLLAGEIQETLDSRKKRMNIMDDVFKDEGEE